GLAAVAATAGILRRIAQLLWRDGVRGAAVAATAGILRRVNSERSYKNLGAAAVAATAGDYMTTSGITGPG
ncbi:MAG TPA: hypothetical protein VGY56_08555, partial [Verrucomicrobiae bacterium]|nr:hypothetical protein [Verrucomicrobiae bacterium]